MSTDKARALYDMSSAIMIVEKHSLYNAWSRLQVTNGLQSHVFPILLLLIERKKKKNYPAALKNKVTRTLGRDPAQRSARVERQGAKDVATPELRHGTCEKKIGCCIVTALEWERKQELNPSWLSLRNGAAMQGVYSYGLHIP